MDPELEASVPFFVRLDLTDPAAERGRYAELAAARIADPSGATVISVGYRLAPEHPYPAALDDVHAVLAWTAGHAAELGIDPARIAVGGHSSGAGPAAAVALRARDRRGPAICCQLLNEAALETGRRPGRPGPPTSPACRPPTSPPRNSTAGSRNSPRPCAGR
ncbi:alpha/beta hydrolase [Streptomyces sp. NPDC058299]|uniref:alpha/beta hydrolase n=1 Tax=Streptomyces sp. NPDC058299 TaxID=3346435 RepID=UPI0036E47D3C